MNLLAVFAHPDDEMFCAATLAQHAARGHTVHLIYTTYGECASKFRGTPPGEVKAVREGHARDIGERIGAEVHFFDFGDTRVQGSRAEAVQLACLYAALRPEAVLTWDESSAGSTLNPDHRATARLAWDALMFARLPALLEEGGRGDLEPLRTPVRFYQYGEFDGPSPGWPYIHLELEERFVELGADIRTFYAEFYGWKITRQEFIDSRRALGREAGVQYAEKFTLRRAYLPAVSSLV